MSPIPKLPLKTDDIPEVVDNETILKIVQSFLILSAYVAVQHKKCRE